MTDASGLAAGIEYHVANTLRWHDLRPLQRMSIEPVRSGKDCLLIAPTAGGKTEAATFPVLSSMDAERWQGLSVLYVAPLRALLNDLTPRLQSYGEWIGRRVEVWHGDVGDGDRRRILADPPDILLTTPESLEAMLVSRRVSHHQLFRDLRAIVVDEVHAFAASDRGWHLVTVLERLQRLSHHRIQRIGLTATLGNPGEVLEWLQGSNRSVLEGVVVEGPVAPIEPDITLDFVGPVENAATVLSMLHRGEKRLVFCRSRAIAEELAYELRVLDVETHISHSSLSRDERRLSERAFAESRNCVIVATSTLELGIDIGDLDHMIQIGSPLTVSSFLQRLGRTGRREESTRNALFLATDGDEALLAGALMLLWSEGFVEPVQPPVEPRHIAVQQLLALALQESRYRGDDWQAWWPGIEAMADAEPLLEHLLAQGFLSTDGPWVFMGPEGERTFGRRHFLELLSSFLTAQELRVLAGRKDLGTISPTTLRGPVVEGTKPLLLGGRAWMVEHVDWERNVVLVHPDPVKGKSYWGSAQIPESFEVMQAKRRVLLGEDPPVTMSQRYVARLAGTRATLAGTVSPDGLVVQRDVTGDRVTTTLWTWAGVRANETIAAALPNDVLATVDNPWIQIAGEFDVATLASLDLEGALPAVLPEAIEALKFAMALPVDAARATIAARAADRVGAGAIVAARWVGARTRGNET